MTAKNLLRAAIVSCAFLSQAHATGWCDFEPGWQVITHGLKSEKVWAYGKLTAQPSWIWVQVNNPTVEIGQNSVSLVMAAQFASRRLQFYIDDESVCSTFPNWGTKVRHWRVVD
jgi:hypothetical protein